MTLLQQRDEETARRREDLRLQTLSRLRSLLERMLPGREVWVFGSVIRPGAFRESSDVDLALREEPAEISSYRLQSLLEEGLGRPVDVVLLPESRFAETILREGQRWTL
jgi:predicted nucleotidyltransferase